MTTSTSVSPADVPIGMDTLRRRTEERDSSSALSRDSVSTGESASARRRPLKPVPCTPENIRDSKYSERTTLHPRSYLESKVVEIQTMTRRFQRPSPPLGWIVHVSPGGQRYFRHTEKSVVTLSNILDTECFEQISAGVDDLLTRLSDEIARTGDARNASVADDIELCVHMMAGDDGEPAIGYYFVGVADLTIFWLEKIPSVIVTEYVRATISESHLELAVKYQFWAHIETFPNHQPFSHDIIYNLRNLLKNGMCDRVTSDTSIFPFDQDQIPLLLETVTEADVENDDSGNISTNIARIYYTIYFERYLAFWGEEGARLDRDMNVLAQETPVAPYSWLFHTFSLFLFFMPLVYLRELDQASVDKTVNPHRWRKFITGLRRDWDNSITPATVLLSANIGFLAINSIDVGSPNKSTAQIASYVSAILSLFIYIVCQILTKAHRFEGMEDALGHDSSQIESYELIMADNLRSRLLAYSLPTALFLWSTITFLAAILFVFFDDTSIATRISVGIVTVILAVTLFLLLFLDTQSSEDVSYTSAYMRMLTFFRDLLTSWTARITRRAAVTQKENEATEEIHDSETGDPSSRPRSRESWRDRFTLRTTRPSSMPATRLAGDLQEGSERYEPGDQNWPTGRDRAAFWRRLNRFRETRQRGSTILSEEGGK